MGQGKREGKGGRFNISVRFEIYLFDISTRRDLSFDAMMMVTIRRADIYLSNGKGVRVEREGFRGNVTVIAFVVVIMLVIVIINHPHRAPGVARAARRLRVALRRAWPRRRPAQPTLGRDLL